MVYRKLGNTGIELSEIGMGCEGMVGKPYDFVKEFIDTMESFGINCLDLYSPDTSLRTNLGKALSGRRERFVLQAHLCTIIKDGQYERTRDIDEVKSSFEEMLTLLNTSHIDIGMIHYVDSVSDWQDVKNGPVMEYALKLKKQGKIRSIGLSSHNPEAALKAVNSGLIDVLMFSINPCYDLLPADEDVESLWNEKNYENPLVNIDPERRELYETCQALGVGITVMKAFGGGDLLSEELSPAGRALNAYQCINYALSRPGVSSVMCGARTIEEIENSASYESASDDEKDYVRAFMEFPKISWKGHCMYCGHCAPCAVGISVADVTKLLNLVKAQGEIPETVADHYRLLEHKAGECIQCGQCVDRCPFEVPILENMEEAAKVFGS